MSRPAATPLQLIWANSQQELGNLANLEYFDASNNGLLNGSIPPSIFNISTLMGISLEECQLSGSLPPNMGHPRSNLDFLSLESNRLSGNIPSSINNSSKLRVLRLDNNSFTGHVPNFGDLRLLEEVKVGENNLSGARSPTQELGFLSSLTNSPEFRILDISKNPRMGGVLPDSIGNLSTFFRRFGASFCDIRGFIPSEIGNLSGLQNLDFSDNQLTGLIPTTLTELKNLWSLDLHSNNLSGQIPAHIGNLKNIEQLDLSSNQLTREIPSSICKILGIKILHLSNNSFDGLIPQCLGKMKELVSLKLNRNKLGGALPQSLVECKNLQVIDIGDNRIEGNFPFWTETLPQLRVLILKENMFKGPLIFFMKTELPFPMLKVFDISYNAFIGYLPANYLKNFKAMMDVKLNSTKELNKFSTYEVSVSLVVKGIEQPLVITTSAFTTIDMSFNRFSGSIPNSIGNLNSIVYLNLSHNLLTGHIPPSLGNISTLESLDMSSNKLTGKIPAQLMKLTFLSKLNLSMNNLYGEIPQSGQFSTFENSSYVGNSELCGFPLTKKCEVHPPPMMPPQEGNGFSFMDGFTWQAVVSGYGSGFALGVSIGYLIFRYRWPNWFIEWIYGIYMIKRRYQENTVRRRSRVKAN